MGRGFTQYAFPTSNAEDAYVVFSAFLNYRLPDDSLLFIHQAECWCSQCNRFELAEYIPTLVKLETDLNRLLKGDLDRLRRDNEEDMELWMTYHGKPVEDSIEDLERRIQWRRSRKSPPKCLRCGTTTITLLPDADEFAHPKTGERVVKAGIGFMSTVEWHAEYTSEGDLISSVER